MLTGAEARTALEYELTLTAACRGYQIVTDIPATDFVTLTIRGRVFQGLTATQAREAVRRLR